MNIGVSKDTSEFACDSLKLWWVSYGQFEYPNCTSILMLADGGGSNSSRHYIFKEDLQNLSDEIGVEIRVAHYPPYTSKWNPVEHRVFPHITRSLKGVILSSHDYVKKLIENTTTLTGLKVKSHIIPAIYETGRKYSDNFKETMRIIFDDYLGQWNWLNSWAFRIQKLLWTFPVIDRFLCVFQATISCIQHSPIPLE